MKSLFYYDLKTNYKKNLYFLLLIVVYMGLTPKKFTVNSVLIFYIFFMFSDFSSDKFGWSARKLTLPISKKTMISYSYIKFLFINILLFVLIFIIYFLKVFFIDGLAGVYAEMDQESILFVTLFFKIIFILSYTMAFIFIEKILFITKSNSGLDFILFIPVFVMEALFMGLLSSFGLEKILPYYIVLALALYVLSYFYCIKKFKEVK